jgi:uncharacterized protein (UPF0332 family)
LKREVEDFLDRARRALATAEELVDRDPDAAASRAYYAAFYAVSAVLAQDGQSPRKHSGIERAVHRDFVHSGKWPPDVGAAFSWLANLRYTGDYGGEAHVSPEEAKAATAKAALVLLAADASLTEE